MVGPTFVTSKEDLEWSNHEEDAFARVLQKLPEKAPCTIRIFDQNGYYTLHGSDAEFVADSVFHNRTILRESKARKMQYAVLNGANFNTTIRELLMRLHYRVEVLERSGGSNNSRFSTSNDWQVVKKASPGDLGEFEELLFGNVEQDNVASAAFSGIGSALCAFRLVPLAVPTKVATANNANRRSVGGGQSNIRVTCVQLDSDRREFRVAEFEDDRELLANLETCLVQFGAREALCLATDAIGRDNLASVTSSEFDRTPIGRLLERIGVCATVLRKSQFSRQPEEALSDVRALLRSTRSIDSAHQPADLQRLSGDDGQSALSCISAIISYLKLTADSSNTHAYVINSARLNSFMRLDAAAVNALDLFPNARNTVHLTDPGASQQRTASASLYSLFATHCRTRQAQRLLASWIRQPLIDTNKIAERQAIVAAFVDDAVAKESIQKRVSELPDLGMIARRLERRKATLCDAYKLYDAVEALAALLNVLSELSNTVLQDCIIAPLRNVCDRDSDGLGLLRDGIGKLLDIEYARKNAEYRIRADKDIDERLFACSERLDNARRAVEAEFRSVKQVLSGFHQELDEATLERGDDERGYVMKVTKSREKFLREAERSRETRVEIFATIANSVHFRTPQFVRANVEFLAARREHEAAQSEAADSLLEFAAQFRDPLVRVNELVAAIDVLAAFATVANAEDNAAVPRYTRPNVLPLKEDDSPRVIRFTELRHACIERCASTLLGSTNAANSFGFIANDVELSSGTDNSKSFYVITGPNMGGKSTFMRSAGLAVILTQMGSFVPATDAQVSVCDAVHCRIGSQDVQSRGVSTFYAEMLDAGEILRCSTRHSLVLIDELGRGTSTADGTALAEAIAVQLLERVGAFTLFATHIFELTALEKRYSQVRNVHVAAHIESQASDSEKSALRMVLLYKVEDGPADGSFGIQCARLAELPDSVVDMAEKKAEELALFSRLNAASWKSDAMDVESKEEKGQQRSIQLAKKQSEAFCLFGKEAVDENERAVRAECIKLAHEFSARRFESRAQALEFIRSAKNPLFRDLFPLSD